MTHTHEQSVRGAVPAMCLGACFGGAVGWLAKRLLSLGGDACGLTWLDLAGCVGCAALAAGVTVVVARRASKVPVVNVADMLGGIALGFVVGYCGPEVFSKLLTETGNAVAR